ncbi:MAG: response regulator [Chthoniobacteraceae bacterium]
MSAADLKQLFGTAVKSKRSALQISQEELADRSGLHRTYISDVERGVRNLSLESIEKLAHALELSVSGLFAQAGNGRSQRPIEILLVEDRAEDVELTLRAFQKARFANPIHVARDGAEALDFLFATGRHAEREEVPLPGVILLDLHLPKVDGVEVLRRIKADPRTRRIPVIVLTESRDYRDAIECKQLGVESYLTKPVSFRGFSELTPLLNFHWRLEKPPLEGRQ